MIRLDPLYAEAYASRARAYTILGKDVEAEQDVERLVELGIDPGSLMAGIEELKEQR